MSKIKSGLCVCLLLLQGILFGAVDFSAITEQLKEWQAAGGCSSGFVALMQGERCDYFTSFGAANFETHESFTLDTRFLVASITKQMTAVALFKALEERGLDHRALFLPLAHFLPVDDPIWKEGQPEWAEQMTLHHLLTNSSGLVDYFELPNLPEMIQQVKTPYDLLQSVLYLPLQFEPGSRFRYNSAGFHLVGVVIERLSDERLEDFFETHLFVPLGMSKSSLGNSNDDTMALSYLRLSEQVPFQPNLGFPLNLCWSTGGVVSTAQDLAKWNQWLYQSSYATLMTTPYISVPQDKKYLFEAQSYGYGLWLNEHRAYWHPGGLPGWRHCLVFLPEEGVTVLIARNVTAYPVDKDPVDLDFATPVLKTLRPKLQLEHSH